MSLGITILGGAAAWPNPGQGCSSYLVRGTDSSILLDCGADTLLELRKHIDYTRIDAIVISHCHSDHILDLIPYRYGLRYGPSQLGRRIPVWMPPGGVERMKLIADALASGGEESLSFWSDVFELFEYDPKATLSIGDLRLSFARTQHPIPCFAIRVDHGSGKSIAYGSDTGSIEPLLEHFDGADVVVAEATLEEHERPAGERVHMTPQDAGELADRIRARTLVVTHLWSERPDEQVIANASDRFAGDIHVAKPGLRIDV